jgi:hypothetical protein
MTETVSGGVCADCWGLKDPVHARVIRPPPKTWPLLDWNGPDLESWGWELYVLGAVLLALVALLIRFALGG